MAGIFWGIFFTTLQVDFLYLNYIMPAFGMMLLCLQLRKFSEKNTFFGKAFRFSVFLLLFEVLSFGISATPLAVNEMVGICLLYTSSEGIPMDAYDQRADSVITDAE